MLKKIRKTNFLLQKIKYFSERGLYYVRIMNVIKLYKLREYDLKVIIELYYPYIDIISFNI